MSLSNSFSSDAKSISSRSLSTPSAPIFAVNPFLNWLSYNLYSLSVNIWPFSSDVSPLSVTIYLEKYKTDSSSFVLIPNNKLILLGVPFEYQICATGVASSICPILSLLTFEVVTSTPHFSHVIPLYLILLYFPHAHS